VVACLLLDQDDGLFLHADNAARAAERYGEWQAWTVEHGLGWDGVSLDIEPDIRVFRQVMEDRGGLPRMLLPRLRDAERPRRAHAAYTALVDRIRADGWRVESYQFPFVADERRAGSTCCNGCSGWWISPPTVTSGCSTPPSCARWVPAMLWSYGPEATAVALGTTGGGADDPGAPVLPTLGWEELAG
jgi:hypothetical protein